MQSQGDGNVVGYAGATFASTGSSGHPGCVNISNCLFIFRVDDNVIVYVEGAAVWNSGTAGTGDILYFDDVIPSQPGERPATFIKNAVGQIIFEL